MSPLGDGNIFPANLIHVWFGAHDRLEDRNAENSNVR